MKHEQNVMLQCIRYVVSNNFLKQQNSQIDNENSPATKSTSTDSTEEENSNRDEIQKQ